jgi:hypothetical protein
MQVSHKDIEAFRKAIERNPQAVKESVDTFLAKGKHLIMSSIKRDPWRVGMTGGGSPIALINGGNLFKAHHDTMSPWSWEVKVNEGKAPYAVFVHEGTRYMSARPWLDYAVETKEREIYAEAQKVIDYVVNNLAK